MVRDRHPSDFTYPSAEVLESPYDFYRTLREQAPVYELQRPPDYIVSLYEDVIWVSRHSELFSNLKRWGTYEDSELDAIQAAQHCPIIPTMADNDPPSHDVYRRIVSTSFTPARLRSYEPRVRQIVDRLIDEFVSDGTVEFVSQFANRLPMMVICDLLGLPPSLTTQFRQWSDHSTELQTRYVPKDRALMLQRSSADLTNYLADFFAKNLQSWRLHPAANVLSELVNWHGPDESRLSMSELVSLARQLLIAGNETTAALLANSMRLLLHHPDQLSLLAKEHSLIVRTLEESLRIESSPQWGARTAMQDIELRGVKIPAGSRVVLMRGSANRDDRQFADPDEFDIRRTNVKDHVGFGTGLHSCLGAPLARLEGRVAYEALLARLKNWRLTAGKNNFATTGHPLFRAPRALYLDFDQA